MRVFSPPVICFLAACLLAGGAPAVKAARAAESDTRIEVDETGGAVRIIVDGKAVVVIDTDGLHVEGQVASTGSMRANKKQGEDGRSAETGDGASESEAR